MPAGALRDERLNRSMVSALGRNALQWLKCEVPHFPNALVIPKEILRAGRRNYGNDAKAFVPARTDLSGPGSLFMVIFDDRETLRIEQPCFLVLVQKPDLMILWQTLQLAMDEKNEHLAHRGRVGQPFIRARMDDRDAEPKVKSIQNSNDGHDASSYQAFHDSKRHSFIGYRFRVVGSLYLAERRAMAANSFRPASALRLCSRFPANSGCGSAPVYHSSFGGTPASISYSGVEPGYLRLYQFNVVVPNMAVTFSLGGTAGTQALFLAIGD